MVFMLDLIHPPLTILDLIAGSPFCRRSRSFSRSRLSWLRDRGECLRLSLDRERERLCLDLRDLELDRERLLFGDLWIIDFMHPVNFILKKETNFMFHITSYDSSII